MIRNGCRLWVISYASSRKHSGNTIRDVRWVPVDQIRPEAAACGLGQETVTVAARPLTDDEARRHLAGALSLRDIHT